MAEATVRGKVIADILAILDASAIEVAWTATPDDPNYGWGSSDGNAWVAWNVDLAATDVAALVLDTPGHSSRADLLTLSAALTHGQVLPPHIGEHGDVLVSPDGTDPAYVPAFERSLEAVLDKKASTRTLGKENYFITDSDRIYFSAKSAAARAKVYLGNVTLGTTTSLESYPAELLNAVACRALAKLFPQGGDHLLPAQYFNGLWRDYVSLIKQGKIPGPVSPKPAEVAS